MNSKPTKTLIVIVGPTAIGKTALSIKLAQHFETAILSADSRQFFKEMSIGTAAPSPEEINAAPHHFIQHLSIQDAYSVGDFERDAISKLDSLFKTKSNCILIGGSGLYVDAVTKGLDYFPPVKDEISASLKKEFQKNGIKSLQDELKVLDPEYYQKVALQNPQRVLRALAVCKSSGKAYSSFLTASKKVRDFNCIKIGLTAERAIIYERINQRVEVMLNNGLLEEVQKLLPYKDLNALNTVGYKELFKHLEGSWGKDFAISEIQKNTRRFAKRQMTWFKRDSTTKWFNYDYDLNDVVAYIEKKNKTFK